VYQMATEGNVSYMVTELLDGETLRERLRRGPVPIRKAIDYAVQIAHGLAAAHDKGITHRDLKPDNLFVTKDGRAKILDFGLAKVGPSKDSSGEEATLGTGTEPGMVMGTAGYMSPEQVRGKTADHRSDIFAFGTILYEMVTGKQTFRKPTSAETMTAILNEEPPSISQIAPASPPGLQRVVHRCLEKSPEQRFQSASDLAFALEALSDSASTTPSGGHAHLGEGTSRRGIAIAGAALVVLLGVAAGSGGALVVVAAADDEAGLADVDDAGPGPQDVGPGEDREQFQRRGHLPFDDVERTALGVAVLRVDAGADDQFPLVRLGDVHVHRVGHHHGRVHRFEQL